PARRDRHRLRRPGPRRRLQRRRRHQHRRRRQRRRERVGRHRRPLLRVRGRRSHRWPRHPRVPDRPRRCDGTDPVHHRNRRTLGLHRAQGRRIRRPRRHHRCRRRPSRPGLRRPTTMTNTILIGESFGLDANLTMSGEGPAARRRRVKERARSDARYRKALSEAKALLNAAWAGDRIASIRVNEAITTSDLFKSAAGEVLDVELLAAYAEVPTQWTKFAARTTVRNFKPKQLRELVGSTATLARVPEHTNYPEAKHSLEERSIQVNKF